MPNVSEVPELSLADYSDGDPQTREAFSKELLRGLQRYGFIILRNHPVSVALLDKAYDLSMALFAEPLDVKRRYVGGPRGYAPLRTEHAKNCACPDLKEFWQIGPDRSAGTGRSAAEPPNIWPSSPPAFKETFLALFEALQHTGQIILEALTPGLELPSGFFAPLVRDGNSVLRLLHYPPVDADADPGSVRAAAHEDINLITLLLAAQDSGLELLDRDGQWLPVTTDRNKIIVDSGDMLARMTNDVIPATTHRVVNPSGRNVSRYSIPFFMHPDSDVVLSCIPSCIGTGIKYPDIMTGTFLEQRLREIGLLKTSVFNEL
jgi:isopenicillin N synthase-like dioxygenase